MSWSEAMLRSKQEPQRFMDLFTTLRRELCKKKRLCVLRRQNNTEGGNVPREGVTKERPNQGHSIVYNLWWGKQNWVVYAGCSKISCENICRRWWGEEGCNLWTSPNPDCVTNRYYSTWTDFPSPEGLYTTPFCPTSWNPSIHHIRVTCASDFCLNQINQHYLGSGQPQRMNGVYVCVCARVLN